MRRKGSKGRSTVSRRWWASALASLGLAAALPLSATESPAAARRASLESRVAAVRSALQEAPVAGDAQQEGNLGVHAQWFNWPNWNNWNNWVNWGNWGNWSNWFNG